MAESKGWSKNRVKSTGPKGKVPGKKFFKSEQRVHRAQRRKPPIDQGTKDLAKLVAPMFFNEHAKLQEEFDRYSKLKHRATAYTVELGELICFLMANGLTLRAIEEHEGMPTAGTVVGWRQMFPVFSSQYARARELQADFMDHRIQQVADHSTSDSAPADRVKLAAYMWRAAKLAPHRYGDKIIHEQGDEPYKQINATMSVDEAAQLWQERIQQMRKQINNG